MKIEQIPEETRKEHDKRASKFKALEMPWRVKKAPESGIAVVTHGERGKYKVGVRGWIVGGDEREVFLNGAKTVIPEFDVILEGGFQFVAQYGRDVIFRK